MSRIGLKPVEKPSDVDVVIEKGGLYGNVIVKVKGPLGELSQDIRQGVSVDCTENIITLKRADDTKQMKSYHGLYRSLISNMIDGVKNGYVKELEIHGVGFRVALQANVLDFSLGQHHPLKVEAPKGISFEVKDQIDIKVSGIDKALVGKIASEIRALKKTEPYKGKGIRYKGENVRRKAGKTAAKGS